MTHIVQAEFFHVGGKETEGLDELIAEVLERRADDAPIKTTIRFYDEKHFAMEFIELWKRSNDRLEELRTKYDEARSLSRLYFGIRYYLLLKKHMERAEEKERLLFAQTLFREVVRSADAVVIEDSDHRFRKLGREEFYDLQTAVGRARNVWLFVFKHNDLYADTNVLVGNSM